MTPILCIGHCDWLARVVEVCEDAGLPVVRCPHGAEGLLRVLRHDHQAVLVQLDARGMGGREVCLAARLSPGTARMPLFLVGTPDQDRAAQRLASRVGADGWLPTCLTPVRAVEYVRRELERARPGRPPAWPLNVTWTPQWGQRVGPWTLREELGSGGYASVRAARDAQDREAAVKLPRVQRPSDLVRCLREVAALQLVRAPEVVRLQGWGWERGLPWLALERLRGESLSRRIIYQGRIGPELARRVAVDVARALAASSAREVVHRDVTPANIWLREGGGAMLIDFGLSKGHGAGHLSRANEIFGTVHYIAPEVLRGQPCSLAADLYGLGASLRYALSERHGWELESTHALLKAMVQHDPPPPSLASLRPDLPPWLCRLVSDLESPLPAQRMNAFQQLLRVGEERELAA